MTRILIHENESGIVTIYTDDPAARIMFIDDAQPGGADEAEVDCGAYELKSAAAFDKIFEDAISGAWVSCIGYALAKGHLADARKELGL
jgi:hypothetical protein